MYMALGIHMSSYGGYVSTICGPEGSVIRKRFDRPRALLVAKHMYICRYGVISRLFLSPGEFTTKMAEVELARSKQY